MLQTVAHCTRIACKQPFHALDLMIATGSLQLDNEPSLMTSMTQGGSGTESSEASLLMKSIQAEKLFYVSLSLEISLNPVYSGLSLQHFVGPPCSSAEISPVNQASHSRAQQTHLSM